MLLNKCHMLVSFKLLVREPYVLFPKAPPAGLPKVTMTNLSISLGQFVTLNTNIYNGGEGGGLRPREGLMKPSREKTSKLRRMKGARP